MAIPSCLQLLQVASDPRTKIGENNFDFAEDKTASLSTQRPQSLCPAPSAGPQLPGGVMLLPLSLSIARTTAMSRIGAQPARCASKEATPSGTSLSLPIFSAARSQLDENRKRGLSPPDMISSHLRHIVKRARKIIRHTSLHCRRASAVHNKNKTIRFRVDRTGQAVP